MKKSNWYILKVLPNRENKVKLAIEAHTSCIKEIDEILIPEEKVVKMISGKKKIDKRKIMPGYILVKFKKEEINSDFVKEVEGIKNVMKFLRSGNQLEPIKQFEYERIAGVIESSENIDKEFMIGEVIIIKDGPFATFKGEITSISQDKERINVIVNIFGRATPVDVNYYQVERII